MAEIDIGAIQKSGKDIGAIQKEEAAPPTGAIMNQLQKNNLGSDLFNGVLQ